jgi:hypothetical protein
VRALRVVLIAGLAALAVWAAWTLVAEHAETAADREPLQVAALPEATTVQASPSISALSGRSSEPLPVPATAAAPVEALHEAAALPPRAGITVRTIDARGATIAGVRVSASLWPRAEWSVEAITGTAGTAWLECAVGTYTLFAQDDSSERRHGFAWDGPLDVTGSAPSTVALTLPDANSRIEILVRDSSGRPLKGVRLEGRGAGPPQVRAERQTDASGLAVWEPVVAGPCAITIMSDLPSHLGVASPEDRDITVWVEAGVTARGEFVCPQLGGLIARLEGVSLDAELVGVTAYAEQTEIERQATAGTSLVDFWLVPPGSYVLSAEWRPDSAHWSRPLRVEVASDQETVAMIEVLECQARLTGHVRDTAGLAVRGVVVAAEITDPAGGSEWTDRKLSLLAKKSTSSGEDGSWAIAVPIGRKGVLRVDTSTAADRYLARYEGQLDIVDYERPFELVVEPGFGVEVRLEGDKAALADNFDVSLNILRVEAPPPLSSQAHRERDGSFRFKYVGAGHYNAVLRRSHDDVLTKPVAFEIEPGFHEGETVPVTLTLSD